MKNATLLLLTAASLSVANAEVGPSRGAGYVSAQDRWPKFKAATATTTANALEATEYDADQQMLARSITNEDGAGKMGGLYRLFRFDDVYVFPLQQITAQSNNADTDMKVPNTLGVLASTTKTFYMTIPVATDTIAKWAAPFSVNSAVGTNAGDGRAAVLALNPTGNLWGACQTANMSATVHTNATTKRIQCASVISAVSKTNPAQAADDYAESAGIVGRLFFSAGETSVQTKTVGSAANDGSTYDDVKSQVADPDFIMGSFYQSNGITTDSTTWCNVTFTSATDAQKILFNTVIASGSTANLHATKGLGPKTKCTWQVSSHANTHGPMFKIGAMASVKMAVQVIEWYDYTTVGTNARIPEGTSYTATGTSGNSPTGNDATSYAIGTDGVNGIFFNPIKTKSDQIVASWTADPAYEMNAVNQQYNAMENTAGSIGTALYYDRSTGQTKDSIRSTDSSWGLRVQEPYLAVTSGYDSDKSTYDSAKTAYETAFTANAKDGKTTVPTRPDKPSTPAAYTGAYFLLDDQALAAPTQTWGTSIKAMTGTEMVLATEFTSSLPTYTVGNLGKFNNRLSYYQTSADDSVAFVVGTNEVQAAFGRLGQSATMGGLPWSPFYWGTVSASSTKKPAMQISVLPEYFVNTRADYTADSNGDTVNIEVSTAAWATLSSYGKPTTPTAATAISVGAKYLAASISAVATIAATLY